MQLDDALQQIAHIRHHLARHEVFRACRSAPVAFSGVVAILGAAVQPWWVANPADDPGRYLALWVSLAALNAALVGAEIVWRAWQASSVARHHTRLTLEQFAPCILVGALLTLCIYRAAPDAAWLLPGLWSLTFALGVCSVRRLLPRQGVWVAVWYTLAGCGCLLWGPDSPLSPWAMGVAFGGGQLLGAAILYCTLERPDAATDH